MNTDCFPYLSVILFLPAAGAVVIGLLAKEARTVRLTAALFTFVAFALSIAVFVLFDRSGGLQFIEEYTWIESLGAKYHLGVDGLGLSMLILTTFISLVSVFVSWKINMRVKEFFIWILLLLRVRLQMDWIVKLRTRCVFCPGSDRNSLRPASAMLHNRL